MKTMSICYIRDPFGTKECAPLLAVCSQEGISQPEFVMGTYQVDIFIDAASKMSWGTALRRSDVRPKLPGEWNLKLML